MHDPEIFQEFFRHMLTAAKKASIQKADGKAWFVSSPCPKQFSSITESILTPLCCHAQFSSGMQVRPPPPKYTSEIKGLRTAGFLLKKYTGKSNPSRFVQPDQICLESLEVNRSSLLQAQYSSRFCNQFSAVLKRSMASIQFTYIGTNTHFSLSHA